MISRQQQSLSLTLRELLLSHSCTPMSECVLNREAHSLFIFFRSLEAHSNMSASLNNYLLELTINPKNPSLISTWPTTPKDTHARPLYHPINPKNPSLSSTWPTPPKETHARPSYHSFRPPHPKKGLRIKKRA